MKTLILIVAFLPFLVSKKASPLQQYISKFNPETKIEGDHIIRVYPKFTIEVTLSFGLEDEQIRFIESVIESNYSGEFRNTDEISNIVEIVQSYLGGLWGIHVHEDPYLFYTTSVRRSSMFVIFDVNGQGFAIFKEA
ncbi:unnamed protein product [Caenorhabditis bovis]|uniref:Uncharacterized protein n=1 Tax=Caenorhabditis bovis TaxID=2654633 RepID=A0A8S1EXY9_9PELO|nr:unnamed protein product [Caenorhabditis bovis]